ncbi:hypothetical protein FG05_35224 [Fusarium graminearum]|nr:hypothetical protein FG05_35224 [Fusarium graminearum]
MTMPYMNSMAEWPRAFTLLVESTKVILVSALAYNGRTYILLGRGNVTYSQYLF